MVLYAGFSLYSIPPYSPHPTHVKHNKHIIATARMHIKHIPKYPYIRMRVLGRRHHRPHDGTVYWAGRRLDSTTGEEGD